MVSGCLRVQRKHGNGFTVKSFYKFSFSHMV